jgi:hypothetical protein
MEDFVNIYPYLENGEWAGLDPAILGRFISDHFENEPIMEHFKLTYKIAHLKWKAELEMMEQIFVNEMKKWFKNDDGGTFADQIGAWEGTEKEIYLFLVTNTLNALLLKNLNEKVGEANVFSISISSDLGMAFEQASEFSLGYFLNRKIIANENISGFHI